MLKGTTDQIMVSTNPTGANVSINGQQSGKTPFVTTVPSSQDLHIHLSKAGYQDQTVTSEATFRWGYEFWSFVAYVIPLVVDLSDGAAWGHQQTMIAANLDPVAASNPVQNAPAPVVKEDPGKNF
jgi:hypothetical protein